MNLHKDIALYVNCSYSSTLTTCTHTHLLLVTMMNLNGMDERMTSELWEMSPASYSPSSQLTHVCFLWFALIKAVPACLSHGWIVWKWNSHRETKKGFSSVCGCYNKKRTSEEEDGKFNQSSWSRGGFQWLTMWLHVYQGLLMLVDV